MTKPTRIKTKFKKPLLEALEPRFMMSADIPGMDLLIHTDDSQDLDADSQTILENAEIYYQELEWTEATTQELIVIDSNVPDYQSLIDDIQSQSNEDTEFKIVLLNADEDGILQISSVLSDEVGLDALHIISHGDAGEIYIGNSALNLNSTHENAKLISTWSDSFDSSADILIYGCDLTSTSDGEQLVDTLAILTETDVAASDDVTGHESLGGDWELEYTTGDIETDVVVSLDMQDNYQEVLAETVYESNNANTNDFELKDQDPAGQTFKHTSGDGTYDVNRISIELYEDSSPSQTITVSLQDSWNGTVLGSATISSTDIAGSFTTYDFDFTNVTLDDGVEYTIKLTTDGDGGVFFAVDDDASYSNGDMLDSDGEVDDGKDITFSVNQFLDLYTVADDFESGDSTGNTGTVSWSRDWALSGDAVMVGGELQLKTTSTTADREADLSGATTASFSFDFRTEGGVDSDDGAHDSILVEVSSNGGTDWVILEDIEYIDEATSGTNSGSLTYDISDYIATNTQVRFSVNAGYDSGSEYFYVDNLNITYSDTNSAPTFDDGNTLAVDVVENSNYVATPAVTDSDGSDTLTYSINGGVDYNLFEINSSTGELKFITAPDFEKPTDNNGYSPDGVYEVQIAVSDGNGGVDTQDVSVTVTDDNNTLEILSKETTDLDGDGFIDAIHITFDKAIDDSTVVASDFDVAGITGEAFVSTTNGDTANDSDIYVTFNDGVLDTAAIPSANYTQGTLADLDGNLLASDSSTSTTDAASPIASITRDDADNTDASSVTFSVDFSEDVSNVDATDFSLNLTDVTANSTVVVGDAGDADDSTYTVTVDTIDGYGTLGLDIAGDTDIVDLVANAVDTTPVTDEVYTISTPIENSLPSAQTTDEDTAIIFNTANLNLISISDADAGSDDIDVTIDVSNGTLTLSATTGLVFTSGSDASSSMTIQGTLSEINAALDGMSYAPTADYNGSDTLTIHSIDSVYASLNIDGNLQAHYDFEDTSSGTLVNNATTITDADRGEVLSLDGDRDYFSIAGLSGTPVNATLAAWVNLADGAGAGDVISLGDSLVLRVDDVSNGISGAYYNGSSWVELASNTYISNSGWTHIAYSFDDASDMHTLYINGEEFVSSSTSDTISYTLGSDTIIGANGDGSVDYDVQGEIDDVYIFDRVLTAEEIATLANDIGLEDSDTLAITVNAVNDAPTAVDDTATTDEDTVLNVTAPGVLSNDSDSDATQVTSGATLNYDAANDSDGVWNDDNATGFDWTLDASVTHTNSPTTAFSGITSAYTFDGTAGATQESWQNLPDNPSDASASFELWFRPTNLTGEQILFETGGETDGTSIYLDASTLYISTSDGGTMDSLSFDLTTLGVDPTSEFIQLVSVIDTTNSQIELFVNGNTVGSIALSGSDWAGGDASGLGQANSNSAAGSGNFIGDIAIMRFYEEALDASAVQANYGAITGIYVSAVNGNSTAVNSEITLASGALVTMNSDGSYDYNPNGVFASLAQGESTTDSFTYDISDGTTSSTATVTVTIDGVNDAPIIANGSDLTYGEGSGAAPFSTSTLSDVDSSDFDGGVLTFKVSSGADGGEELILVNISGVTTSGTDVLVDDIVVGVQAGGSSGVDFTVTFNSDATTARVEAVYQALSIGAYTDDDPTIGVRNLEVTISDGDGATSNVATATADLTTVSNDTPTLITAGGDISYTEGDGAVAIHAGIGITDVDDVNLESAIISISTAYVNGEDILSFTDQNGITGSWDAATGILTLTGSSTVANYETALASVTYTNTSEDPSTTTRTLSVSVNDGDIDSTIHNRDITITAQNDAPTVSNAVPDQTATEDAAFSFAFAADTFNDVDGDTLTYTSDAAGWLSFDGATRTFSGTPLNADVGTTTVTVTATDPDGLAVTDTFDIVISNTNDAPTVANIIPDQAASEDAAFSFTFAADTFSDLDGDTLTYTSDASGWLSFNTVTREFTGTPLNADVGTTTVTVTADDGNGETITDTFDIVISNTNNIPVANSDTAFTINEDTTANSIDVLGNDTDTDGDTLNITAATASNGTLVINADKTLNYTPNANYNGSDTITYTVDDGNGGSDSATVAVTINPINDAPTVNSDAGVSMTQDSSVDNINVLSNDVDVDGDVLSVTNASASHGAVTINANGTLLYTPDAGYFGSDTVTYDVNDGNGATTVGVFSVTINPHIVEVIPPVVEDETPVVEDETAEDVVEEDNEVEPLDEKFDSIYFEYFGSIQDVLNPFDSEGDTLVDVTHGTQEEFYRIIHDRDMTTNNLENPDSQMAKRLLLLKPIDMDSLLQNSLSNPFPIEKFRTDLDAMYEDIDNAFEEQKIKSELTAEAAAAIGVSMTAGFVAWLLRSGSLLASFFTVMPIWRNFDPVSIVAESENRDQIIDAYSQNSSELAQEQNTEYFFDKENKT